MLEHVNNIEGIKLSGNELLVPVATHILEKWNDFVAGTITREQFVDAVDTVWTPEKNQELINSNPDGKIIHFANFAFNGIKTQDKDQHMPGTQ